MKVERHDQSDGRSVLEGDEENRACGGFEATKSRYVSSMTSARLRWCASEAN